jgi:hypothetical protein
MSRAKLDRDVAERCLGHLVGGKVERTYDRWAYRDEKADAYAALAKLIEAIINPPPAKGVSSLDEERAKRKHKRRA